MMLIQVKIRIMRHTFPSDKPFLNKRISGLNLVSTNSELAPDSNLNIYEI